MALVPEIAHAVSKNCVCIDVVYKIATVAGGHIHKNKYRGLIKAKAKLLTTLISKPNIMTC